MQVVIKQKLQLTPTVWQLNLAAPFDMTKTEPGQFLQVRVGDGLEHVLRRPISIARLHPETEQVTLVFRVVGAGTAWLAAREPGDVLDVLGPLGSGFPLPNGGRALVVGGGLGVPPLLELCRRLVEKTTCQALLGFRTRTECFWEEEFQGYTVGTTVYTDDGSHGSKGTVLDGLASALAKKNEWTHVYACGPLPLLQGLAALLRTHPTITAYVSLEERMACGIGACYGCAVPAQGGAKPKRVCVDGPVFRLDEVIL